VVENATGSACEQDVDYYPYGGEENDYCTTEVSQNYKFTGKERDAESNLDEFGARYYASSMGRFMQPDWAAAPTAVPYAHYGNPQSLNLYSYVQNNPTTLGDPDGHVDSVTGIDIAVEIATYIATHPEEVQAVEAEAAAGAGASSWGLLAGPALYFGAMLHPATVGQSDTAERATMQQAQHEREQENGGADPQVSTSGAGARQGGGGLSYENPGPHDPTRPNFVPGKTPLPSDAQAVFGTAIQVTGRAAGTGDLAYGINEKGQFYRYSGQNGVLHYSGTIATNKVPKAIRKQLQGALKQQQSQ
jgi:RHS repeat-associated protein